MQKYYLRIEIKYKEVTGPLGDLVKAHFGILGDGETAVIEMASASGLPLVPKDRLNPLITTTYGTGELIKEALDLGCKKIVMGIGGSATNDCGSGMLQALGYKLLDENDNLISPGAKGLLDLRKIDVSLRDKRLDNTTFLVASDVNNPLYGPNGAAYIYGPQKGATAETLPILDNALRHFDKMVRKHLNKEVANIEGSGAAGGLGGGLLAFLNANLMPGFIIIKDIIKLEDTIKNNPFDLIITGEGQIDSQTVNGKLPVGVGRLAKKYNVPVIAFVGSIGEGAYKVYDEGIDSIMTIVDKPMALEEAFKNAKSLLEDSVERFMRGILSVSLK